MKRGQVFRSNKDYFKTVAVIGIEHAPAKPGDTKPKAQEYHIINVESRPDGWFYKKSSKCRLIDKKEFKEKFSREPFAVAREVEDYLF